MYIGNIQSIIAASNITIARAAKSNPMPEERAKEPASQSGGGDSVTISQEALRAAQIERTLAQPADSNTPGDYPLEMYQVPQWTSSYHVVYNEGLLGKSGNWEAENYPKWVAATQDERGEYDKLIKEHYQALLEKHGIDTVLEHYNAMIVDKVSSEALRQEFEAGINNDERMASLIRKLGMGPSHST